MMTTSSRKELWNRIQAKRNKPRTVRKRARMPEVHHGDEWPEPLDFDETPELNFDGLDFSSQRGHFDDGELRWTLENE